MATILVIDDDDTVRLSVKLALEDAREKAKAIADVMEVQLGKLAYVQTSGYVPPSSRPIYFKDSAGGIEMPETPISPGELEVQVSVQVSYEIG